jgi:hypothetical protein
VVYTVYAPLTEVLTVVAEEAILVFSKARTCSPHDLFTVPAIGSRGPQPYRTSLREAREGSLFHRSTAPVIDKAAIVHNGAAAHVDTVVYIA